MAKSSATIFGIIFVIAGIWGFFSDTAIGFVAADTLSSIIHLVAGIILLAVASKASAAAALKTIGIVYVIFAILGFIQGTTVLFGSFVTDMTTTWFYLVVGIVVAVLGFASKGRSSAPAPQM